MKQNEIKNTLTQNYSNAIRHELIQSILSDEKENSEPNYKIINQIFSYVLSELGWEMVKNTNEWDKKPLKIMKDTFPQVEKTKWYNDKILTAKNSIDTDIRYNN